jgi:hypothetical protein
MLIITAFNKKIRKMSVDTTAVSERSLDFDNASPKIGFPKNSSKSGAILRWILNVSTYIYRSYILIHGLQIHFSKVEDYKFRPAGIRFSIFLIPLHHFSKLNFSKLCSQVVRLWWQFSWYWLFLIIFGGLSTEQSQRKRKIVGCFQRTYADRGSCQIW